MAGGSTHGLLARQLGALPGAQFALLRPQPFDLVFEIAARLGAWAVDPELNPATRLERADQASSMRSKPA